MTMTITLSPEQEERLKVVAAARGLDWNEFATASLIRVIEDAAAPLTPPAPAEPRPFGLAKGEFVVPDDFDTPLPEDVLADFEGRAERV